MKDPTPPDSARRRRFPEDRAEGSVSGRPELVLSGHEGSSRDISSSSEKIERFWWRVCWGFMVDRHDDPRAWISAYFSAVTAHSGSPLLLKWSDKRTGSLIWGGAVRANAYFKNGDTDSTEGPGDPMRLSIDVLSSTFSYAVAFDDELAALDWALRDLAAQREPSHEALLASLRTGWEQRHDHSHLWRGDKIFPMLQQYAEDLTSLPANKLTLQTDPPCTVQLSYRDNHVFMAPAEHDTVTVWYEGQAGLYEYPVWVRGLNSWIDDFYRRLRTEDYWLVRTEFLGIPIHRGFLFDNDAPPGKTGGPFTKHRTIFLPATLKTRSTP